MLRYTYIECLVQFPDEMAYNLNPKNDNNL